jgi:S1-C subfamily serine protease
VLVTSIEKGSPAYAAGLHTGDVIVEFAGTAVAGIDDLHRLLTGDRIGQWLPMTVLRQGRRVGTAIAPAELTRP